MMAAGRRATGTTELYFSVEKINNLNLPLACDFIEHSCECGQIWVLIEHVLGQGVGLEKVIELLDAAEIGGLAILEFLDIDLESNPG